MVISVLILTMRPTNATPHILGKGWSIPQTLRALTRADQKARALWVRDLCCVRLFYILHVENTWIFFLYWRGRISTYTCSYKIREIDKGITGSVKTFSKIENIACIPNRKKNQPYISCFRHELFTSNYFTIACWRQKVFTHWQDTYKMMCAEISVTITNRN